MRKGKSVIGQDVYSMSAGLRVESVKDLVLEDGEDGVVALLVSEGGLLGTSRVVPFASIVRFGPSAVMIDDADSVIPAANDQRVSEILERRGTLLGTRVLTEDGEDLGRIGDLYFDESSGRITGYEVSGGMLGDVVRGTSYLPFDNIRVIGKDAVIVSTESKAVVEGQKGGLAAALDSASSTISEHIPSGQEGEDAGSEDPASHDPDGELVGARAQSDVLDGDGSVIVANGQMISLQHVQQARAAGRVDELYQAVGRTRTKPASEEASEAVAKVADTASDLWSRFTTRLSEMTDAAGQRMDAQQTQSRLAQVNDAIGRPVTKVFLDRDDSVILDLGDLVTHQAIQRADDAGLLDSLLGCVYKATDVTFSREEMRAGIEGDSTVDKASGGASVVAELESKLAEPPQSGKTDQPGEQGEEDGSEPDPGGQGAAARRDGGDGAQVQSSGNGQSGGAPTDQEAGQQSPSPELEQSAGDGNDGGGTWVPTSDMGYVTSTGEGEMSPSAQTGSVPAR